MTEQGAGGGAEHARGLGLREEPRGRKLEGEKGSLFEQYAVVRSRRLAKEKRTLVQTTQDPEIPSGNAGAGRKARRWRDSSSTKCGNTLWPFWGSQRERMSL